MNKDRESRAHNHEMSGECVFCQINRGSLEASHVMETEQSRVIISLEGHPLVIPKTHYTEPGQNLEATADVFTTASQMVHAVRQVYQATGVNITANIGRDAGQEVDHFHVHVIPRTKNDGQLRYARSRVVPLDQRMRTADQVRAVLVPSDLPTNEI